MLNRVRVCWLLRSDLSVGQRLDIAGQRPEAKAERRDSDADITPIAARADVLQAQNCCETQATRADPKLDNQGGATR